MNWLRWQATCIADDIRRLKHGLGVLWRSGGHGKHALMWGETLPDLTEPITGMVIPRKPVNGRPPWETAPLPVPTAPVCLIPAYDPAQLHPVVQAAIEKNLGVASINEFVVDLFAPVWAAV